MPCSNAAKTRNPLKLARVPQTRQQISAVSIGRSSPYYEDMWRRYCCLTSFFPVVDRCLSCEDTARETYAMVHRWTQSEFCTWQNSVRGQEPPKMYIKCASPGDGQTSCKVWLASGERRRCSNEVKTRNPLKLTGVPQTNERISATGGPKFTILSEHIWRRCCCLTSFFFRLSIRALVAQI